MNHNKLKKICVLFISIFIFVNMSLIVKASDNYKIDMNNCFILS